jgi:hypothetical protein
MVSRPILFSARMVRALLAGPKTQTRRVMKPQPTEGPLGWLWDGAAHIHWSLSNISPAEAVHACPYGQPGDRLWVRETFKYAEHWNGGACCASEVVGFKADGAWLSRGQPFNMAAVPNLPESAWRPSIFMPRWASRILLEVTEVRVQRVQDISEEDAKAEGVTDHFPATECNSDRPYREGYAHLWDSINGKRPGCAWADNPWVWAVTFRRITDG